MISLFCRSLNPTPRNALASPQDTGQLGGWINHVFVLFGSQISERGRRSPRGHGGPGDTLTLGVEMDIGLRFFFFFFCCGFIIQCFVARSSCRFSPFGLCYQGTSR
ncbi:hypothetical protein CORC01_05149 [Colletotrichum orchidophilum]|uniref:Uncharacterized protein n=1 Tax=Colletotrichum orchidophilum TaxID=1209926 RepID=A0A1G4BDU9_9PEZI|nr:uncharacterized protein CORC01_05149 [Colletotrichum orchidophilum]OHE99571.1 hypothetical protein CORC01_05149 [Colletotrichum orchidophilum]